MNHLVVKLDLGVWAVDTVTDQDAVGEIRFFIEEEGDQVAAAGTFRIYRQSDSTVRADDFQKFIFN